MKKSLRVFLFICLSLLIILTGFVIYISITSASTKLNTSKLLDFQTKITYYSARDEVMGEEINSINVTEIEKIPAHVKNAFISIEDKRFYSHKGVDYKGLMRATWKNITSFSFKEGASTISQQLIKNTHLSNDKTINRKIKEISLAKKLEKKYSKDEILEMYLNTIYFGNGCFGITKASDYYFSKSPSELTVSEGAILAGLIKSPANYSPTKNIDKCFERKNVVLDKMFEQKYISKNDYLVAKNEKIQLKLNELSTKGYIDIVDGQIDKIIDIKNNYNKNIKVFTYCDLTKQKDAEHSINEFDVKSDKSIILMDKNSKIISYASTCGEINRQMGSTLKPILVYTPAIETDTVHSLTPILDEKTDFNGYSPRNYNDNYLGYVSVKNSLIKSQNVPAVKILNYTGIEKALKYVKKTDIPITEKDNHLAIALGSTEKGAKLSEITSAYSVFNNDGYFRSASCIRKIIDENGRVIYSDNIQKNKVFSDDSAYIVSDMLKDTVKTGTAKKLSFLPFQVYAKTGTVGNENGNTDAYSISYNKDYILGVWFGNRDNSLMNNSVSGGTIPCQVSYNLWKTIYNQNDLPEEIKCDSVEEVYIDKTAYENERKIIKDDSIQLKRYQIKGLFKKSQINNLPQKPSIVSPKLENVKLSVKYNLINMQLCLKELTYAKVYKWIGSSKNEVFDTKKSGILFSDHSVKENSYYKYSIIPYVEKDGKIIYGKEIIINKIKTPTKNVGDNWWINEY